MATAVSSFTPTLSTLAQTQRDMSFARWITTARPLMEYGPNKGSVVSTTSLSILAKPIKTIDVLFNKIDLLIDYLVN